MMTSSSNPTPSSNALRQQIEKWKFSIAQSPVIWLIGGLLAVRLLFILFSPVDLIADESYYWDWSRRLDYGYYSKPPMIAWVNWLSTSLLGNNEFAVRLPAALLGTLGLVFVYQLGARMFSHRVGLVSMILLALTPGQTALSFLMTIDAPFLFFWAGSLYGFWMLTSTEQTGWKWPVFTAMMIGLGILSKQTMLGFFPLAGLFLLITPERRALWGSARVWLTALASLAFLTPVILWNIQHDWITLEHTASHFSENSTTWMTQFARFGEFFLGQIGVVNPVLWFAIAFTLIAAVRQFPKLTAAERYLLCFSGVPLVAIFALSATRRLEPNWPAACYPAGVILTTAVFFGRSTLTNVFRNRDVIFARSWKTGLVCTLITYAAITIVPNSPLAGSPVDITCRLRGWKQLAHEFDELTKNEPALKRSKNPLIISTAGRDITSALAFYLPKNPLIPHWSQDDAGVLCQYDLWDKPNLKARTDAIVITQVDPKLPNSLNNSFSTWTSLGTIEVELGGGRKREYEVYRTSHAPLPESTRVENVAAKPQTKVVQ